MTGDPRRDALGSILLLLGACSRFGVAAGAPEDASADVVVVDAGVEASVDAVSGLACGDALCSAGDACCLTREGPRCGGPCDGGFSYSCLSSGDCAGGACCLRALQSAACEPSCRSGDYPLCADDGECHDAGAGPGECRPATCNSPGARWSGRPFKVCPPSAGASFAATRNGVVCAL